MLSRSIKKIIPFQPFHRAIDETLKILESVILPEYWSSALPAHTYKMVITAVCVQIDSSFCNT